VFNDLWGKWMENCRVKYINQVEVDDVLQHIELNGDRLDMMIEEIISAPSCNPKHLISAEELENIKGKYSDIL